MASFCPSESFCLSVDLEDLEEAPLMKQLQAQGRQLAINGWHREALDNAAIMLRIFRRGIKRKLGH